MSAKQQYEYYFRNPTTITCYFKEKQFLDSELEGLPYGLAEEARLACIKELLLQKENLGLAKKVDEVLEACSKVQQKVKLATCGKIPVDKALKTIKRYKKRRRELFRDTKSDAGQLITNKYKELKEAEKQQQAERLQAAHREEEERKSKAARRANQIRFAAGQFDVTLRFSSLKITERALFRWNDRGKSQLGMTIEELLQDIDDAKIFYRLFPSSSSKENEKENWEVQLFFLDHENPPEVTLVLDKHKKILITVIRDDEAYYKNGDKMYAPAGKCRGGYEFETAP